VDTVKRLDRDFAQIIAIKEAAGDIVQAMEMIRETSPDFLVISGDDMITLPMVLAGGAGVISVIGEGFPSEFSRMVRLGLEGKATEAFEIHHRLAPSIDFIFEEGNPAGIKALLAARGLCSPNVRMPLVAASEGLSQRIAGFLRSVD
jgi:4-hydroxy-tetrahydrodipicolinate synthase